MSLPVSAGVCLLTLSVCRELQPGVIDSPSVADCWPVYDEHAVNVPTSVHLTDSRDLRGQESSQHHSIIPGHSAVIKLDTSGTVVNKGEADGTHNLVYIICFIP